MTEPSELRGDVISRKAAIEALIELAAPADVPHALEDIYDKGVADSIGVLESLPSVPEPSSAPTGLTRERLDELIQKALPFQPAYYEALNAMISFRDLILESSSAPTQEEN